jgi:hypothetical protein
VYIQTAQIGQKNESLSKNKCSIFYQDLFANEKLSYKLFSVIQTIDNHQSKSGWRSIGWEQDIKPITKARGYRQRRTNINTKFFCKRKI